MSAAYRRGRNFAIRLPLRTGGWKIVSSGTTDRATAKAMHAMGVALRAKHEWALLETVTLEPSRRRRRAALDKLFDAHRANALERLRGQLDDVDLTDYLPHWQDTLRARLRPGSRMVERYVTVVRTLMPEGKPYPRSTLTPAAVAAWQASAPSNAQRTKSGQAMRIQRRLALSSFCEYLRDVGVLTTNPVREVKGAGKLDPKVVWIPEDEMRRLINAHVEPHRTLSALLHGTGLEISAALAIRKRDIDVERRAVRAPGTKTFNRDRVAKIRAFAWPYVERHIKNMLPSARLFEGITYEQARRALVAALEAADISVSGYTLHSARHSFAVQLRREGVPFELIARNLGHKDTAECIKCYGRYDVDLDQWAQWEARIERNAAAEKKSRGGAQ